MKNVTEYGTRYLVFGGYLPPGGGVKDLLGFSDDLEFLSSFFVLDDKDGGWLFSCPGYQEKYKYDWWHIFDTKTMRIVAGSEDRIEAMSQLGKFDSIENTK